MKRIRYRWLLPISGLLTGLTGGWMLRSRMEPESSVTTRMPHPPTWPQPVSRHTGNVLPEELFDRLRSTGTSTLRTRIKMEQLILAMPAEEARKRMLSATGAGDDWLRELLFFRAAEGLGETFYFPASMSLVSDYHGKETRSRRSM